MNPRHNPRKTRVTCHQKSNLVPSRHPMSLRRMRALVPVTLGPSTATLDHGGSNTQPPAVSLVQQAETLALLNEKVASLEEAIQSFENELEEETLLQEAEYQCPLCLDLAWYPYVCLSRYKAQHDRKRLEDPIGTDVIIRCPAC
ncbi:MAG: hypothetical protein NXY57DRAFT_1042953 [Lentinula lateritia]|nr:MAG: hypothetical protein NXY57DRAFT_1042953 [Lentinula lateritia]